MDFDLEIFTRWISRLRPEYVWVGFNTKPRQVQLPEPDPAKLRAFMDRLVDEGVEVRKKDMRD